MNTLSAEIATFPRRRPVSLALVAGWTFLVAMLLLGVAVFHAVQSPEVALQLVPVVVVALVLGMLAWLAWTGRTFYGALFGYACISLLGFVVYALGGTPGAAGAVIMGVAGVVCVGRARPYFRAP